MLKLCVQTYGDGLCDNAEAGDPATRQNIIPTREQTTDCELAWRIYVSLTLDDGSSKRQFLPQRRLCRESRRN